MDSKPTGPAVIYYFTPGLSKIKSDKILVEIKLQYKNERAGFEEKGENEQEINDMHICRFCDTSKTNAKRI